MDESKYFLGIAEIDKSHSRLLKVIQKLQDCFDKGEPFQTKEIGSLIDDAQDFASQHFHQEEELMLVFKYPLYRDHRNQHDLFFKRLEQLSKLRENELLPKKEIQDFAHFLNSWFQDHICSVDKRYAEWIKSQVLNIKS